MLLGGAMGCALLTQPLVMQLHGYDHGFGETAKCAIPATFVGVALGLCLEGFLRSQK